MENRWNQSTDDDAPSILRNSSPDSSFEETQYGRRGTNDIFDAKTKQRNAARQSRQTDTDRSNAYVRGATEDASWAEQWESNSDSHFIPDNTSIAKAITVLGAKLAKADGFVSKAEIAAFKRSFCLSEREIKDIGFVFNMAKQDVSGFEEYALHVGNMYRENPRFLEYLLHGLFPIILADGALSAISESYLKLASEIFGFDDDNYGRIRAHHKDEGPYNPYRILGVPPDVSEIDLKRVYRKLVLAFHPDKAMADGLPNELLGVANETLARINAAYDSVLRALSH